MLSIEMLLKVATPEAAVWVSVPERVPPAGLVPMATVTVPTKLVAVLPPPSRAVTVKPNVLSAVSLAGGWVVKANWVAAPALTVILPDVALVRPVAVKVRVRIPIVPVIARFVKVATPLVLVLAVSVPPSVPPPVAIAAVTTTAL